jgi:hypothetical protein
MLAAPTSSKPIGPGSGTGVKSPAKAFAANNKVPAHIYPIFLIIFLSFGCSEHAKKAVYPPFTKWIWLFVLVKSPGNEDAGGTNKQ